MPSPNLEIFRFGFYVFFPVYVMFKVGDPEWYDKHVIPYKEMIWPNKDEYKPPRTQADMKAELARFRAERAERKAQLEGLASGSMGSADTSSVDTQSRQQSQGASTPVADAVAGSSTGWSAWSSAPRTTGQTSDRLV